MSWVLPHPKPHRLMVSRVIVKQGKNNTMPGTLLYLVCIAVALTPADAFAAHPSCASLRHSTVDDVVRSSFSQYRQRRDCWTTAISMSSKGFGWVCYFRGRPSHSVAFVDAFFSTIDAQQYGTECLGPPLLECCAYSPLNIGSIQ